MQKFLTWLASSPLATFAKVFVAVYIGAAVSEWAATGAITLTDYQDWIIAALVAAIPVVINWLNPQFPLYGRDKAVAAVEVVEK